MDLRGTIAISNIFDAHHIKVYFLLVNSRISQNESFFVANRVDLTASQGPVHHLKQLF